MTITMMPKLTENETALRDAVTEQYLETGDSADAATLAKRLGWSAQKVRKVMKDGLEGVCSDDEWRPSYSRSYKGHQSGAHKVAVYYPTRAHLRDLLLEARKP